jgi:single-stranded-DNA-specific exonuclease
MDCRFEIPDCPPELVAVLRRELGVSDALAQILVRRGHDEPGSARRFLAGDEEHEPSAFAGIERSVELIAEHIRHRERITVHGDYDVDGICSTAILLAALAALGADADSYLPDRATDGYGLSVGTVERLAARGTRLLVTADCAITAVEEVRAARALGMAVVVTDHHAPRADGDLPAAPIVHPAVCGYPFEHLCAAAVAFKLAQALFDAFGRDRHELDEHLDLVALATIADVVPLVGENRTLARRGLRALAATEKPGLRALMSVARVDPARLNERTVGFALAPRLNAAGRLYRADAGLELVMTADRARAAQIADELDRANHERRMIEQRISGEAQQQLREQGERAAYVLAAEGWHAGVIGIVASRMVEQSGRPVVVIGLDGERGRGSGRSIEAFDLLGGLSACSQHLLAHGGHRAAAGLEIERDSVAAFAEALDVHAAALLGPEELLPVERVDAVVGGADVGMALAEELRALEPFGRGNPGIALLLDDARFSDARPMGEGKHVRFTVSSRGASSRAVAFGKGGTLPVEDGVPARATFTLEVNEWNGISEPRLVLRRAQELAPQPALEAAPEPRIELDRRPVQDAAFASDRDSAEEAPAPGSEEAELVLFALP